MFYMGPLIDKVSPLNCATHLGHANGLITLYSVSITLAAACYVFSYETH